MNGPYLVVCWGKGRIFECYFHETVKGAEARALRWQGFGPTHKASVYDLPSLLASHRTMSQAEIDDLERWFGEPKGDQRS